jgi:MFS family permease
VSLRRAALLGTLCAPGFMVVLDSNMVTVALPALGSELGFSRAGLQWVIGAWSLAFGGALLLAGRAGDLFGRGRLFTLGTLLFATGAVAAACSPSGGALLAARVVEGLGAALALPASLALMTTEFEGSEARTRALGVYGMTISAAFVCGVAAGGALTAVAGWRAVLLATAPVGLAAAAAGRLLLGADKVRGRLAELELPGALAASGAALDVLYALGLAARAGRPSPGAVALFGAGVLLAGMAALLERRSACPLIPRSVLRTRNVGAACAAALLTVATGVGVMFVLSLYLQQVLGYGPAAAGLVLSPLGVAGVVAGSLAPAVARRVGVRNALVAALATQAAGAAMLIQIGEGQALGLILAGTAVIGIGHFGATVAFTALATGAVREDQRGVVLGLVGSGQQLGGALGLVVVVADGLHRGLATAAGLSALAALLVVALTRDTARRPRRASRTRRRRAPSSPRSAAGERGGGSRAR